MTDKQKYMRTEANISLESIVMSMYTQGKKKRTTYFFKVFARIL